MAGGDTGRFPAPLHCITRIDGEAVDPQKVLRADVRLGAPLAGPAPPHTVKKSIGTLELSARFRVSAGYACPDGNQPAQII